MSPARRRLRYAVESGGPIRAADVRHKAAGPKGNVRMQTPRRSATCWALVAFVLGSCVGCDQLTKKLASDHLQQAAPLSFLGDTVRIQYAENPGAFLGAGAGLSESARFWILIVVNALFLSAIAGLVLVKRTMDRVQMVAAALLLSGGIGNLIDRLCHDGLVVDFLNLGIGPLRTGIFNVADMAIMAGFALLLVPRRPAHETAAAAGGAGSAHGPGGIG